MSEEKKEYPRPSLTADNVVVTLREGRGLSVLFIRLARDPFQGMWALPGGFVEPTETVAEAAARELMEETSLGGVRIHEVGCFSRPGRDPRGWVVTVAHLALVPGDRMGEVRAGDDAASAAWLDLRIVGLGMGFRLLHEGHVVRDLAFDHRDILAAAVKRLRDDVDDLAFDLLPAELTLDTLAGAYGAIYGETCEPRALGDSLLAGGIIQPARDGLYRWGLPAERLPTMLTDGG